MPRHPWPGSNRFRFGRLDGYPTDLGMLRLLDVRPERCRERLTAEADPEDRHAPAVGVSEKGDLVVHPRGNVPLVDAGGAAERQNEIESVE